jgi:hypothetical protein
VKWDIVPAKRSIKTGTHVGIMKKKRQAALRVFQLLRDEDISGVSGVGRFAAGVVFPSGKAVLEWLGANNSFEIFDNVDRVDQIHRHGGRTRIVFKGGTRRL